MNVVIIIKDIGRDILMCICNDFVLYVRCFCLILSMCLGIVEMDYVNIGIK